MVEMDRIKITHTHAKRNSDIEQHVKVTFKLYNIREDGELLYWGTDQSISRLIEKRISKKEYSAGRTFMIRKYFQQSSEEPILLIKVGNIRKTKSKKNTKRKQKRKRRRTAV